MKKESPKRAPFEFHRVEELIEDLREGKMVVLVDDEDRENEGDLVLAADFVSAVAINFMAKEARGLICLALASEQIERLQLPMMVREDLNSSPNKTAFTVTIEAAQGVTTGISAADRAHTIRAAVNPLAKPGDVHTPGHVFPIRAQQGGVLKRAGHTEGSVDLAKLAGLRPAAVICEVMNEDGTMARVGDLQEFAHKHQLKVGTIVDLIKYRLANECLIEEVNSFNLPEYVGKNLVAKVFRNRLDNVDHLVIQKGEVNPHQPTLVRVQLDLFDRNFFEILANGTSSLVESLRYFAEAPSGVFVLLRGNNRHLSVSTELQCLLKGETGHVGMDQRDYGIGAQILRHLGVRQIRLLTNHPEKKVGLKAFHLELVEIIPLTERSSRVAGGAEEKATGVAPKATIPAEVQ